MKYATAFQQLMQSAYERASVRHIQAGHGPLSLRRIALETGIAVSVLSRMSRGISQPESEKLSQLLVYLGCDEGEQQCIFHLAELATPQEAEQASEQALQIPPIIEVPSIPVASTRRSLDRLEMEILSLQAPAETPSPPSKKQRMREKGQS